SLSTGEAQGWTFAPPPELRDGATLRIRPRYQFVEGVPGVVQVRVTPFADGVTLAAIALSVSTVEPADVPLPPALAAAAQARLVFEPLTPGAVLGPRRPGLALRGS